MDEALRPDTSITGSREAHGRDEVVLRRLFIVGVALGHLQVEQRRPRPHGFANLQVVLLSREARRALVVWWQHFDVHRGNGRPEARRQGRGENVSSQTGETLRKLMERMQSRMTVRSCRRIWWKNGAWES